MATTTTAAEVSDKCQFLKRRDFSRLTCLDGTPATYYSPMQQQHKWNANNGVLIWFGEGLQCDGDSLQEETAAAAACCKKENQGIFCSSKPHPTHITGESIFCQAKREKASSWNQVFVPSCSGNAMGNSVYGALVELNEMFALNSTTRTIVIGGTADAGVALARQLSFIRTNFPTAKLVLDSSFSPNMMRRDALHQVLSKQSNASHQVPVLILQSQYDLSKLEGSIALAAQEEEKGGGSTRAYFAAEALGEQMRTALHSTALLPGMSISITSLACASFGYVLPTKLHAREWSTTRANLKLTFNRNLQVYSQVEQDLWEFIEHPMPPDDGRLRLRFDKCRTFLCNSACPERVAFEPNNRLFGKENERRLRALVLSNATLLLSSLAIVFACVLYRGKQLLGKCDIGPPTEEDEPLTRLFSLQQQQQQQQVSLQVLDLYYFASLAERPILNGITVEFPARQMHAIVGVSGGGKTTLLELMARARHSGVCIGTYRFLENNRMRALLLPVQREWIGLVKQQDMFFETLTIMEHLRYTSCLRRETSSHALALVLQLFDFPPSMWDVQIHQLSGGERKRLSIASQFVSLPRVFLLDEPTTGLDANQAIRICRILHQCCTEHGMTVVLTLHQAREEIFDLTDTLTLLLNGRVVVSGKTPAQVFALFGIQRRGEVNLADELMDQVLHSDFALKRQQAMATCIVTNLEEASKEDIAARAQRPPANVLDETSILLSRTIQRGGMDVMTTAGWIALLGGMLVCLVFYTPAATEPATSFEHIIRLDYVLLCGIVFLQSVFVGDRYWMERFVFDFEANAGVFVRRDSFALALVLRFVMTSTLETLAFIGPPALALLPREELAQRTLLLVLCALCTSFQYLFVEILFTKPHDKQTAAHINIAVLSASFLFNGFILRSADLPSYLTWVPYGIASFWSFSGLLALDLRGKELECHPGASRLLCALQGSGDAQLRDLGLDQYTFAQSTAVLFMLLLAWIGLVIAALVRPASKENVCLCRRRRKSTVWVLEEEHDEAFQCFSRALVLLILGSDLALCILSSTTFTSTAVYALSRFSFIAACIAYCTTTSSKQHWVKWIGLISIDSFLLLLQASMTLHGNGNTDFILVLQAFTRALRIGLFLHDAMTLSTPLTTAPSHDDDDEKKEEEEEMALLLADDAA